MNRYRISKQELGLLALFGLVAALSGCNGDILRPGDNANYRFKGLIVVDPNRSKTIAAVDFRKDSAPATTGTVKLDGSSLTFDRALFSVDSVFSAEWNSIVQLSTGNHTFLVSDSTDLSVQAVVTTLPATVSVTGVTPANRISNGNEQVQLTWTGGFSATAFVAAAVLRAQTYTGQGYSLYATDQNAVTFPREAFYRSNPNTPDTGWYYLYVYAFTGSPDSSLSRAVLPVQMPSQLTDNISTQLLAGHCGTITVAVRDSMHITLQP